MKLYSESGKYKLYHGSMLDMLDNIQPNSIDSIVTDPPYELNFMGKGWDNSGVSFQPDTWRKCYEVLKPGGHMLVFGGSRTFHRIACAIEDAGFEIRDTIMWIYGSGFPKSMNIGLAIDKKNGVESPVVAVKEHCKKDFKDGNLYAQADANKNNTKCFGYGTQEVREPQNEWKGWGTCLKPSFEPIIVVRKPPEGTLVDNVLTYGVGGINIDECRVPMSDNEPDKRVGTDAVMHTDGEKMWYGENGYAGKDVSVYKDNGRFPANTILTYDESDYEEVCGGFPSSGSGNNKGVYNYSGREYNNKDTSMFNGDKPQAPSNYNDNGSASRYFYCAKASKKDRNEGLDDFEDKFKTATEYRPFLMREALDGKTEHNAFLRLGKVKNNHPTVKPTELMQYLVRLVTPNGGTILDPFNGSGSTGKAVMYENREKNKGYRYIGIELNEEYLPISKARIEHLIDEKELEVSKEETVNLIETLPSNKEVSLW
jgi:site-specific DNA-methyltransferase (adenine-specific)